MQQYVPCQGFAETKYQGLVGQLGFTVSCTPAEISLHSEPAIFIPIMKVQGWGLLSRSYTGWEYDYD